MLALWLATKTEKYRLTTVHKNRRRSRFVRGTKMTCARRRGRYARTHTLPSSPTKIRTLFAGEVAFVPYSHCDLPVFILHTVFGFKLHPRK